MLSSSIEAAPVRRLVIVAVAGISLRAGAPYPVLVSSGKLGVLARRAPDTDPEAARNFTMGRAERVRGIDAPGHRWRSIGDSLSANQDTRAWNRRLIDS